MVHCESEDLKILKSRADHGKVGVFASAFGFPRSFEARTSFEDAVRLQSTIMPQAVSEHGDRSALEIVRLMN